MRFSSAVLASTILANVAFAQANNLNEFEYGYCGATSFTSRSSIPGSDNGWVCSRTNSSLVRGTLMVNDANGVPTSRINGLRTVNQDQSCITQEQFEMGIFLEDANNPGQPDAAFSGGVANPSVRTGLISLPVSTLTTPCAWIWTLNFTTPVDGVVPLDGDYWIGHWCPSNGAWTADGISNHESEMVNGSTGDNPSVAALNSVLVGATCGSTINETAGGVVGAFPSARVQRNWAYTEGTTFRLGADIDPAQNGTRVAPPNFGMAGFFPDHAIRNDGLSLQVRNLLQAASPTTPGITLMSFNVQGNGGWNPTPVNPFVPGFPQVGNFYLDIVGFGILGITIPTDLTTGFHQSTVVPFGALSQAYGVLTFQHVQLDLVVGRLVFSNAARMNSL